MKNGVVIAGGGQAGLEAAAALRSQGYAGSITLICEELRAPYQRPPLSKDFLAGKQEVEHLPLRAAVYYENHQIDLILGDKVTKIDAAGKSVRLASNREIAYDHLVLAVGARNRPLPVMGAERALYLRTVGEAQALRQWLGGSSEPTKSNNVVVIGGGFIGLEVAAAARAYGKTVTVIEALPRLMARAVPPVISDYFFSLHAGRDVNVMLNSAVVAIEKDAVVIFGKEAGARETIPADLVVAGIGVIPNTELARDAGLAVGNGIVVDEFLRTSDPSIFAIGDCAEHPNPFIEGRTRLESVQNAVDQAKNIARTIIGNATPYREVPWFWTDQFEVRFQMAGLSAGHDQPVIRGEIASNKFSVFYFKQGRLLAADSVNRFGDHIAVRKLLAHELVTGTALLTPEHAADETVDLKKLMLAAKL